MSDLSRILDPAYERFLAVATIALATGSILFAGLALHDFHRPEPATPALRSIVEGQPMRVLGAQVGQGLDVAGLVVSLKSRAPALDWDRALSMSDTGPDLSVVDSLFVPVHTKAEAFAICSVLAGTTVSCQPAVASAAQLREIDGSLVGEDELARRGVTPYRPSIQRWTKVVALKEGPGPA